ncbi:hypothetical protein ACTXT7_017601 [Hymenolepis weldensis]
MRAKGVSNKLKHPEEQGAFDISPTKTISIRMEKSMEELIGGYGWADPIEIPPQLVPPQGLRVNADVEAYVETLQATVVKPPWIDSVVNGGRPPCVFQPDSLPSHKALKPQNWMDRRESSSSCHTRLMVAF